MNKKTYLAYDGTDIYLYNDTFHMWKDVPFSHSRYGCVSVFGWQSKKMKIINTIHPLKMYYIIRKSIGQM